MKRTVLVVVGVVLQVVALSLAVRTVVAVSEDIGPVELVAMAVLVAVLAVAGQRLRTAGSALPAAG